MQNTPDQAAVAVRRGSINASMRSLGVGILSPVGTDSSWRKNWTRREAAGA
jgi:hypothetical protein